MRAASWVALSVFRESIRDRVPYNLVLFAVLLITSSFLLGQLTAGQDVKIIKDLGLAATGVFGLFIAVAIVPWTSIQPFCSEASIIMPINVAAITVFIWREIAPVSTSRNLS